MTVIDREYGTEDEAEIVDVSGDSNALATLSRAEIDMQISTAKKYPRSLALAKRRMIEMATLDQETAKTCGYALKRKDKSGKIAWIEGPSIRMAEIAVSCWGNLRYGARVIEETDRFIVAQGVCHDLETNVYNAIEVRRRITDRNGRKYGDDMVGVTANAACAIAQRNAVFKVVPRAIINPAYDAAMRTASGDERTFTQRRGNALAEFKKLGVTVEEIVSVLGKPANSGIEDIDTTDLRRLHGLLTAINDGETTVEQVFRPQQDTSAATDALNERLKAKTTNRPTSEGQKFEPTPEAIAEAAAQQADEPGTVSAPAPVAAAEPDPESVDGQILAMSFDDFNRNLLGKAKEVTGGKVTAKILSGATFLYAKANGCGASGFPKLDKSYWPLLWRAVAGGSFDYETGEVKTAGS